VSTKRERMGYGCEEKKVRLGHPACGVGYGGPQGPRAKVWNKVTMVRYGSCHRSQRDGTPSKEKKGVRSNKVDQRGFGGSARKHVSLTALDTG